MEATLIQNKSLKNGLTVQLLDASRPIAGDRWFVSVIARMEIPVTLETLGNTRNQDLDLNEVLDLLGGTVLFEQKQERNFIGITEKEGVMEKMMSSFSALAESYFSHPEFAGNYILKQFMEMKKRQSWYP